MTREYTTKLLELVEEGLLDPHTVLNSCLNYMSEDDVKDMCQSESLIDEEEEEESEEDEDDEQ